MTMRRLHVVCYDGVVMWPFKPAKRGRNYDDEMRQIRLLRERHKLAREERRANMVDMLASDPKTAHLAVIAEIPGISKMIQPQGQNMMDRLTEAFLPVMVQRLTEDSTEKTLRMLSRLRGGKSTLDDLLGDDEDERGSSILTQLADSRMGQALGDRVGQVIAAQMQQATRGLSQPQAQQPVPPAVEAPAGALSPGAVLQLARTKSPEEAAAISLQWAQSWPDFAALLQQVINLSDEQIQPALSLASRDPQWGAVASWLANHPDWRAAFVAEIRRLVTAAPPELPERNGHAESPVPASGRDL